jgi:hypothetical protein
MPAVASSVSSDAVRAQMENRLLEEAMSVSDALTRLRGDAQELLRGPMNRDTARQLAVIRRGVVRHREHINGIVAAAGNSRIIGDNPVVDVFELTRVRIADVIVYLDLAAKAVDQAAGPDPAGSAVGDADGLDLRPNPAGARTPAGLVAVLRDYRVWAGEPSYREMSERNNGRPASSTIYTALSSDELPKLDMVMAIVIGCGGAKEDQERFASAWRAIRTGATTPSGPEKPDLAPAAVAAVTTNLIAGRFPGSLRDAEG